MTQNEFAKHIGISRAYLSVLETGDKVPSAEVTGKIELLESSQNAASIAEEAAIYGRSPIGGNVDPKRLDLRIIPVFSFVQAGIATDYEDLPRDEWEGQVEYMGNDEKAFGLRIVGDSMEPKYSPGDIVIVSPKYAAVNGQKVVAKIKREGVVFKIMHHSGDGKMIELTSYNPAYPPIIRPREDFHWIYPVKNVWKS